MEIVKKDLLVASEVNNFWSAVKIYYDHPNSVNKQILFSKEVFSAKLKSLSLSDCHKLCEELSGKLAETSNQCYCLNEVEYSSLNFEVANSDNAFLDTHNFYLLVRKLIPKYYADESVEFFEFIFCDKDNSKVCFITKDIRRELNEDVDSLKLQANDPFAILKFRCVELVFNSSYLELLYEQNISSKAVKWLEAIFITKFTKFVSGTYNKGMSRKNLIKIIYNSKVDVVQYYRFYKRMKLKYGKYLIENWTENTDPKKFVYEDIGIATYVMMLWNGGKVPDEETKKQKFVDLGCGNGLLVHILNSEGHLGIGLDIQKRKIWATYPSTTVLKEETIIPTMNTSYPEADWLIGNHSDELTAWIPIMARRSNDHCQYFVLPCCPYQLNGMKFQRKNSSVSCYEDFIGYVKNISELCGFETFVDKLRIPSTKRIGLIGLNKSQSLGEKKLVSEAIDTFVAQECHLLSKRRNVEEGSCNQGTQAVNINKSGLDFKVRDSVNKARNCTKLPQEVVDEILRIVMSELLKENLICHIKNDTKDYQWNRGRKLPISELAACINGELLRELKKECKGLQTLLKNHHFLFEVFQGSVQIRSPESMLKICNKLLKSENHLKWKRKHCWFFDNHPDKCPLSDDECSYIHNK